VSNSLIYLPLGVPDRTLKAGPICDLNVEGLVRPVEANRGGGALDAPHKPIDVFGLPEIQVGVADGNRFFRVRAGEDGLAKRGCRCACDQKRNDPSHQDLLHVGRSLPDADGSARPWVIMPNAN
jgi:hypothetical protein